MPKITKRSWTKEEESILREYYPSDLKKCIDMLPKRSIKSIYNIARKLKIKRDLLWNDEDIQFLKSNYNEFGAIYCAEKLNKNPKNVRQKASKLNLKVGKKQISKSRSESLLNFQKNKSNNDFKVNVEHFKDIKTKEIAYFLGYFWADGYVNKKKSNNHNRAISLNIAKEDADAIKPILDSIGDWNYYHVDKRTEKHKDMTYISTCNYRISDFLTEHDFTEKSSVSADKIISKIPIELRPLFFRGLIDGDGYVRFDPKYYSRLITITSTIEQDWSYMEDVMKSLNIKYAIYKHTGKKGAYSIISVNGDNALKFGNYLYHSYEEDKIGLPRKYLKYKEMIDTRALKKERVLRLLDEGIRKIDVSLSVGVSCGTINKFIEEQKKSLNL